jgi:hypothetical protein
MASGNDVTGDKPRPPEALPVITFNDEMTLHVNGDECGAASVSRQHGWRYRRVLQEGERDLHG